MANGVARGATLLDALVPEETVVEPSEPDPRRQQLLAVAVAKAKIAEDRQAKRRPNINKPEGYDHENGIKSRDRVRAIAEVLTAEREVNAMLNLVNETVRRPNSRVLEPACGNGNFLLEILRRKLAVAAGEAKTKPMTQRQGVFEFDVMTALASTYGIDITRDNVDEARERLRTLVVDAYSMANNTWQPKPGFYDSVKYILDTNIICGDFLEGAQQIILVEYSSPFPDKLVRRFFTLAELERPASRLPKPFDFVGATHYLELSDAG